ncbi:MAG: sigma-70 family RNA polymerase sigma factor [Planctomycetes bacterium]|nr:sigma-70 family RNA polymerase sigma factor [Planctomycetota bacterium]
MPVDDSLCRWLAVTACTVVAASMAPAAEAAACPAPAMECTAAADIEREAIDRIGRYAVASWRNARIPSGDWADCSQQLFVELLQRLSPTRLAAAIGEADSSERRELNRAVWCVVQRHRRMPRMLPLGGRSPADDRSDSSAATGPRLIERLREATSLSDRQRRVLILSAEGLSVAEIAARLELPPARISDEKYKGIQRLRREWLPASRDDSLLAGASG